ncbi:unnamed protein product [Sphagnum troendelagicum]|uniref:Uncharacterized protein n=1 Tax=Sphagnum troendelagicum TaxID=128251 RepID=A0ABP0UMA7_9BRYO
MIEHFSKWLELVPLPNYSSEGGATYAFLDKVQSTSFSFIYFTILLIVLFGCEPKLLTSIQQDAMVVIKVDDPNVWI